jgi:hypothetical protein
MRIDRMVSKTAQADGNPAIAAALAVLLLASAFLCVCSATGADGLDHSATASSTCLLSSPNQGREEAGMASAEPETLESAVLVIEKPKNASSQIPYTERAFPESIEAAIAWWMNPEFYANTTEYRNYLRASLEDKAKMYSPETRIFFDFITRNLDTALNESKLGETLILYRGISASVAGRVMNNSEYVEPAFASTAYDATVSLDIFGPRSADGYQNVLVLQRPKGRPALYINEDEREFLMPRGLKWDVIKAINIDNLMVEADFPLYSSRQNIAQFDKVRLIYIMERND